MKTSYNTQIEQVANLLNDFKPRSYNMAAKELGLSNESVLRWLCNLVEYEVLQVIGKGTYEITGKQAN